MALFDIFKSKAENAIKKGINTATTQGASAITAGIKNLGNKKEKIVFLLCLQLLKNLLLCLRQLCQLRLTQPQ